MTSVSLARLSMTGELDKDGGFTAKPPGRFMGYSHREQFRAFRLDGFPPIVTCS